MTLAANTPGSPSTATSSVRRALAIINPRSGNQSGKQVWAWLTEIAQVNGIELVVRETSEEHEPKTQVRDAQKFDRVIASGGDGTIMQVINGIARKNVPLAIVPSGTGNALAIAFKLTLDLRKACEEALSEATLMPLDLGLLNNALYFALRLSIGYEAFVTQDTTRELKTRLGKSAYVIQAIRHAVQVRTVRYRFEMDSKVIRRRAASVWVANAGSLGVLGLDLDPNIIFNDGQLDLCAMSLSLRRDLQVVIQRLFARKRLPAAVLSRMPVRDYVRIITYPKQPIQVDGEVVGTTPCEIRVVPNAIQVCMPLVALPSDGQTG